ncbi:hypothetical protein GOBAR_AA37241 [Gossypium barbadense]|uniref:Uncharacterized protein n=1 Tax=Gossypium barbadense TaxID=3634 RepID=A0A2P5VX91_GOSBA|nr:hypothetical protein GOBAR_AA37241 [Gossypium barbadense]
MEQINAITIQDEEGLVAPEPEQRQETVVSKGKGEVDHNDQKLVGDKVLLDAVDPRIATSEPNEEIPLMVLSIFPYGTVEVLHPKFDTFKVNNTRLKPYVDKVDSKDEECKLLAPP